MYSSSEGDLALLRTRSAKCRTCFLSSVALFSILYEVREDEICIVHIMRNFVLGLGIMELPEPILSYLFCIIVQVY